MKSFGSNEIKKVKISKNLYDKAMDKHIKNYKSDGSAYSSPDR